MARQLCAQGAHVLLVARRQNELQKTAALCANAVGKTHILVCDVAAKNASNIISKAVDEYFEGGLIDVLLLNHGVLAIKPFSQFTDADLDAAEDVMRINYHSYVIARLYLKVRRAGSIAVMGSLSGCYGPIWYSAYSSTKWALRGFIETIRNDLKDTGIFFTSLLPGYVRTELHDAMVLGSAKMLNVDTWMPVDEAATKLLHGVARGERNVYIEAQSFYAQFFDGLGRYAGNWLDLIVTNGVLTHVRV